MRHNFAGTAIKFLDCGFFQNFHALFYKGLFRKGRHFGVFNWQHAVHHFDHGGIRTQGVEKRRKFDANRARSNDQQPLWHAFGLQGVAIRPDQIAVRL